MKAIRIATGDRAPSEKLPRVFLSGGLIAGFGVDRVFCSPFLLPVRSISKTFVSTSTCALSPRIRSVSLSDSEIAGRILERAHALGLPVHATDMTVTRTGRQLHIHIAKYTTETSIGRMDLRLPAASSQ